MGGGKEEPAGIKSLFQYVLLFVTPAKAGVQNLLKSAWIPAFAGMTTPKFQVYWDRL